MQIEDARIRYKQLQNERCSTESIPMQPLHGSPYHVYPASNFPAIKAFQGPNSSLQSGSASPLLSAKIQAQMEMSPIMSKGSLQVHRSGNTARRQTIQETSFTNNIDTEAVVAKINNMFPTASDDHIRLLLKKYYNREAVVISALQVEKNPITMPGPFATPPAQRHLFHSNSAFQMTPPARRFEAISRTDSPLPGRPSSVASVLYGSPRIGDQFHNSSKPHSSPKMKLRYLKTVFPKADETMLLDILANSDNNVQKASETLIAMGYQKRDMAPPKLNNRSETPKREENVIPRVLSIEEKNSIKLQLHQRYKNIAERIVIMALESVNYSEDRASQILQIVQQEDEIKARKEVTSDEKLKVGEAILEESQSASERNSSRANTTKSPGRSSVSQPTSKMLEIPAATTASLMTPSHSNSICRILVESPCTSKSTFVEGVKKAEKSRFRTKRYSLKSSPKASGEEEVQSARKSEFKSFIGRIGTLGHNATFSKGPDGTLLLADYVTWNGANPDLALGHKNIVAGHDASLLSDRTFSSRGHNAELCKGSNVNLAKGSIYSQLNLAANVKCN